MMNLFTVVKDTGQRSWKQANDNFDKDNGNRKVTANNHATFTIQIQGRLRDYLRLLMGHPVSRF